MKFVTYALTLVLFVSCNNENNDRPNIELPEEVDAPIEVSTLVVNTNMFENELHFNGKLKSRNASMLSPSIAGKISEFHVKTGQTVRAGDRIITLDSRPKRLEIQEAENLASRARNEFNLLLQERGFNLDQIDTIPPEMLQTLKIRSGYSEALDKVEFLKSQLSDYVLTAPYTGTIGGVQKSVGEFVAANDAVCQLFELGKKEVQFYVLESEIDAVSIGDEISVRNLDNNIIGTATISKINPQVDDFGLISCSANLKGGLSVLDGANLSLIHKSSEKEGIVIPKEALLNRGNRDFIFRYENKYAKWVFVEVQAENSSSYLISNEIRPGDTILVSGHVNLAHNARVSIVETDIQ